jgi:putative hydrolase of HD superfamily
VSNLSDLLLKVGKLKSIKRSGWVRGKFPDPESVVEHSFRVAFLVLLLGDELKINKDRLIKMALVHDIEEIETGDPVTQRGEKEVLEHDEKKEKQVVKSIFSSASNSEELYQLWKDHLPENKENKTKESDVLYQIGKLATCWQALEYELQGVDSQKLDEWWINAKKHIFNLTIKKYLDELEAKRKK